MSNPLPIKSFTRKALAAAAIAAVATLGFTACAGEGSAIQAAEGSGDSGEWSSDTLSIDFATYNPLSLIIKDQGWLEEATGGEVTVTWVQSGGSNKANEALRAGAVDVGSTAGSAALLARSNGSPIKVIDIYSQPAWAALLVPIDSDIKDVAGLAGKSVAATKGTDPYFFLLQALATAGLDLSDITLQNIQHADGKVALEAGAVEAWSGLDPLLSTSVTNGTAKIIYDNIDLNSYGFLNATESFINDHPDLAQLVVDAYEKARAWAVENPKETAAILAKVAGIDQSIAEAVLIDRTNLTVDPIPGKKQHDVLAVIGPIFVESGDVASQDLIDAALESLFHPKFAQSADPSRVG